VGEDVGQLKVGGPTRHKSTGVMTRHEMCDFSEAGRWYAFSNIPEAAVGIARNLQLSIPSQGRGYGPSRRTVQPLHTYHSWRVNLLQLSWAGRHVGPVLTGPRPLWSFTMHAQS
jgi:hypothetical protein